MVARTSASLSSGPDRAVHPEYLADPRRKCVCVCVCVCVGGGGGVAKDHAGGSESVSSTCTINFEVLIKCLIKVKRGL